MKRRYPLHVHIAVLFVVLILVVGGLLAWIGFQNSRSILEQGAQALSERIGREAGRTFARVVDSAEDASRLLSRTALGRSSTHAERMHLLPLLHEALLNNEELVSVYAGFENGDFFLMRRMHDNVERERYGAPASASFLVQSIALEAGERRGRYVFLDAALNPLGEVERPDYAAAFDPRQRPWYLTAQKGAGRIATAPYVFYSSGLVGATFANRMPDGRAVMGADIRMAALNHLLAAQKTTPGTQIVLLDSHWRIVAQAEPAQRLRTSDAQVDAVLPGLDRAGVPVFERLLAERQRLEAATRSALDLEADGLRWQVHVEPVSLDGLPRLAVVTAIPEDELFAEAHRQLWTALGAVLAVIVLSIPLVIVLARMVAYPLRRLDEAAEAVRRFDFGAPVQVDSAIYEVDALATTLSEMKETIHRFIDISLSVASEHNFDRLLPKLLQETLSAARASSGVLYLNDAEILRPVAGRRADGSELPEAAPLPLAAPASTALQAALAQGIPIAQPLDAAEIEALGIGGVVADGPFGHLIVVPLLNRTQTLVGVMLLLRPDETDANRLSFIGALAGSAAVSLEARELLQAQKRLFDALIQLIAGAIDAKSPYTGGHCTRVPEIAQRLTQAACAAEDGSLAGFQMRDEDWEALHIAAWMHDCGKLTTPEYVVDKATKLETIYDRLHEIRMRFEVLKRDAEIACLKAIAAGTPAAEAEAALASAWAQLDEDFAFVAGCNEGGEFMAPEKLERLQRIGARTWQRTLDDRIGLGHEERARKARQPAPALPATETLLADKPEHRILRETKDPARNPGAHGIRMDVPELSYNLGELYNLSVARGTLTAEERYKINEHSIQTIFMLERLPFPRHLRQVPEIAANHHEKLDGTGYPRRLSGEQLCLLARIMAIADVFEALTAVDRPYKKGKTLSEALRIMAMLRDQRHIDADLFALFVRSGVYLDYAHQFMRPEQIDVVDVEAVLG